MSEPVEKPASEWTPRDHYVRATALLQQFADMHSSKMEESVEDKYFHIQSMIQYHSRLAAIPAANVSETDEDYRP